MPRSYVLMTAMPPTKGHLHLIQFAAEVGDTAEVIVATQPGEPYEYERVEALQRATRALGNVNIHHIRRTLPQEPEEAVGFWDMWADFLTLSGLQRDDFIVASETYGYKLAEVTGTTFIPYDPDRSIYQSKATLVREDPIKNFEDILPEFQKYLRMTVTIFGAESCGKTTLTRDLGNALSAWTTPEWARPYLEMVGPELNRRKMETIWHGQRALQKSIMELEDRPFIIQDTDLYSTLGYWLMHRSEYGDVPDGLYDDAEAGVSDLYIVARSNIPFETDALRYGGDQRERSDQWWIDGAQSAGLPHQILQPSDRKLRLIEARRLIEQHHREIFHMFYQR